MTGSDCRSHRSWWDTPHALPVARLVVTSNWRHDSTLAGMGSKGSADHRSRRADAERHRRQKAQPKARDSVRSDAAGSETASLARRTAATDCAWCGGPITPGRRGPIPKWCSATCRHRAWEQTRAAASGRAAVEVVERRVEVPVPVAPARRDWPGVLAELARQVDDGRIYDRDLLDLSDALGAVLEAYRRRAYVRSRSIDYQRQARARQQARTSQFGLTNDRTAATGGQLEKSPQGERD